MTTIHLPAGTKHIPFDDIAEKMADALHPCTGEDDERWGYQFAQLGLETELKQAVKSGVLPVKDPLTLGPHTFPVGNALKRALVSVNDLRAYVADREIEVITAPAIDTATPAPNGKKWTPERKAELKDFRATHTEKETAAKFEISGARIRQLLPSAKPKATPFAGLIHRPK